MFINKIVVATKMSEIKAVRKLFFEYANALDLRLDLKGIDRDFLNLPGEYGTPDGLLLLALYEKKPAGCVGLIKIDESVCELRRLFVHQKYRGNGIGKQLVVRTIEHARKLGYKKMRLDTTAHLKEAISLFVSLGFTKTPPFFENPSEDAIFMELDLIA